MVWQAMDWTLSNPFIIHNIKYLKMKKKYLIPLNTFHLKVYLDYSIIKLKGIIYIH